MKNHHFVILKEFFVFAEASLVIKKTVQILTILLKLGAGLLTKKELRR